MLFSEEQMRIIASGAEPVLVTALIKYHRSLRASDPSGQAMVLDTLRDLCFGDVTVVTDAETFQILDALYSTEEWPLACPRPMRPFLIRGNTLVKDYLELQSFTLNDAHSLSKKYIGASMMVTHSSGKKILQLPFPKLFKPMHDVGYKFLTVSSRVPVGVLGSKEFMVDDKLVYMTTDLHQRLDDPSVARQLFSSFMRELADLTQRVLQSFTEEATTTAIIPPQDQRLHNVSHPATQNGVDRLKADRMPAPKVASKRTIYPVTPSAPIASHDLDSIFASPESDSFTNDDYFDDIGEESPVADFSDGDDSDTAVLVPKRKIGDLMTTLDGLRKQVRLLGGQATAGMAKLAS